MTLYEELSDIADELIAEFGSELTLVRTTGGMVDPVTGESIAGASASQTVRGLVVSYRDDQIDGVRIMSGDRLAVLSGDVQPLPSDRLLIGGEQYAIVSVEKVAPDTSTVVVYRVQVRR